MTDANLTEIVCVLDRSGSMNRIVDDAIGGFNTMLADQQGMTAGEASMTIVLFDNEYQVVAENMPVQQVKPLDRKTFQPRGSTALLDAVGRTIDDMGRRYASLPEEKRPGKVLFVILTDGHENASHQYRHDRVAQMIKHQTEQYGWVFMYLSADLSAFDHASQLNIGTRVSYRGASGQSIGATYAVASSAARQFRSHGASGMSIMDSCVDVNEGGDVTVEPRDSSTTDGDVAVPPRSSTSGAN